MSLIPEQGREARRGVKPRKAQPVHGSITTDERRSLQVADQAIVLDKHNPSPSSDRQSPIAR
jgi:hypothetical protein